MKAVVLVGPGELEYTDVPAPVAATGEAVVRVRAVSICGSDLLRVYKGNAKHYPIILGHEIAGEVVRIGGGVDGAWVGRRVLVVPLIPGTPLDAQPAYGFWPGGEYSFIGSRRSGGFAEYVTVPVQNLLVVPADLAWDHAAIVEPFTVALHALERGGFAPGMRVVILGAGSLGLCCVQWARASGAGFLVATDIAPPNLAAATRLGADLAVDGGADPIHAVLAATGGADLVVETTGVPKVLEQAVQMVRPHGVVVCLGNLPRQSTLSSSFIEEMMKREAELRGNWMSYSSPFPGREWQATLDALCSGALDAEAMISDRLPLAAAPEVFRQIHGGQFHRLKIILYPPDGTYDE